MFCHVCHIHSRQAHLGHPLFLPSIHLFSLPLQFLNAIKPSGIFSLLYPTYYEQLHLDPMYSHKHLAAYLYVVFGSVFNKTTESLPSSPQKLPDGWDVGLKCLTPLLNRSDGFIEADSLQIDRPGCAVTLNCLLDERSTPTPSVNVTFTLPNDEATNLRQCKEGLEELILGGRGDTQGKGIVAGHQEPGVEHDRSYRKEPIFFSSRHSEGSSETVSEDKDYQGIFDYLLSTIQRRGAQKAGSSAKDDKRDLQGNFTLFCPTRNNSTPFPENLKWMVPKKRSLSYNLARCEESFCHGYNLEKTCGPNGRARYRKKPLRICEMCYPQRKDIPIRHHCERRIEREMQAFYAICALLGLSISVAILLYLFRGAGRRLRMRYQLFLMRKNHSSKSPAARTTPSMDSSPTPAPGFNTGMDTTRGNHTTTNDTGSSMTFSMFQEKFNQLGAVSRTYRKRIQDVFDIESLGPKQVEDKNLDERVFVLPRAPNASVQRYPTHSSDQEPKDSHGGDYGEMGETGQFGTVHRVLPHQQKSAV